MDKLRRALSGDDRQPDEESGIMPQYMLPYGSSESDKENVCSNTCNSHDCGSCDVWPHTLRSSLGKHVRLNLKEQ
ncbi:hypothetical protein Cfor_12688 [Coptotermes formosanus]|uniref:Uncharacterized protein n=1 Tax=Coptotermes formosanus TaxID=36987 RepID=A0A6L2Q491_COPFO|nr:hypothetical protein Cfor_12688 [Coptotermes formosanus]